jgi:hypothetical protein
VGYLLKKIYAALTKEVQDRKDDDKTLRDQVTSLSIFTYSVQFWWPKGPAAGLYTIRIQNLQNPFTHQPLGYAPDILAMTSGAEGWVGIGVRSTQQTAHLQNGFELGLILNTDFAHISGAMSLTYTVVGFHPALRGTKPRAASALLGTPIPGTSTPAVAALEGFHGIPALSSITPTVTVDLTAAPPVDGVIKATLPTTGVTIPAIP